MNNGRILGVGVDESVYERCTKYKFVVVISVFVFFNAVFIVKVPPLQSQNFEVFISFGILLSISSVGSASSDPFVLGVYTYFITRWCVRVVRLLSTFECHTIMSLLRTCI
jgi:hypothetical protein